MKNSRGWLTLSILVVAAQSSTALADGSGFYAGPFLMGGWTDTTDVERTPAQPTPLTNGTDGSGLSGGIGAWAGYDFSPKYQLPVQAELAGSWHCRHDMNIGYLDAGTGALSGSKSNVQSTDVMLSALWNLPVDLPVRPYIGGGVGGAYVTLDTEYLLAPLKVDAPDSSDWNLAWQLQGGATYAVMDALDIRLDYRYIDMGEIETSRMPSGDRFSADLDSHDLRLGVVWHF